MYAALPWKYIRSVLYQRNSNIHFVYILISKYIYATYRLSDDQSRYILIESRYAKLSHLSTGTFFTLFNPDVVRQCVNLGRLIESNNVQFKFHIQYVDRFVEVLLCQGNNESFILLNFWDNIYYCWILALGTTCQAWCSRGRFLRGATSTQCSLFNKRQHLN